MCSGAAEDWRDWRDDEAERQGVASRACCHHRHRELALKNLAKARFRAPGVRVLSIGHDGALIARKAKDKGITRVVFDRGGYQYHGNIKALADAARENGLEF